MGACPGPSFLRDLPMSCGFSGDKILCSSSNLRDLAITHSRRLSSGGAWHGIKKAKCSFLGGALTFSCCECAYSEAELQHGRSAPEFELPQPWLPRDSRCLGNDNQGLLERLTASVSPAGTHDMHMDVLRATSTCGCPARRIKNDKIWSCPISVWTSEPVLPSSDSHCLPPVTMSCVCPEFAGTWNLPRSLECLIFHSALLKWRAFLRCHCNLFFFFFFFSRWAVSVRLAA
jgi:hypothetical protein